jgi:cytoskeletal protein CcmA (bactofilin family)
MAARAPTVLRHERRRAMSDPFSTERTFFSAGTRIEGTLVLEGEVKLQGQVKGKVSGSGVVTVGEQATIEADIDAPTVVVHGNVKGEVHATERLELHRSARVRGKIRAPRVRIDEGAVFEGECRMGPAEGAVSKTEPPRSEERKPAITPAITPAPVAAVASSTPKPVAAEPAAPPR